MTEFINHTNHPSSRWEEGQRQAAEAYGTIVDLPSPPTGTGRRDTVWQRKTRRRFSRENRWRCLCRASLPIPLPSYAC